jgi:hypothetical protein
MTVCDSNAVAQPGQAPDVPNDMSEHVFRHRPTSAIIDPLSISAEMSEGGTTILLMCGFVLGAQIEISRV